MLSSAHVCALIGPRSPQTLEHSPSPPSLLDQPPPPPGCCLLHAPVHLQAPAGSHQVEGGRGGGVTSGPQVGTGVTSIQPRWLISYPWGRSTKEDGGRGCTFPAQAALEGLISRPWTYVKERLRRCRALSWAQHWLPSKLKKYQTPTDQKSKLKTAG